VLPLLLGTWLALIGTAGDAIAGGAPSQNSPRAAALAQAAWAALDAGKPDSAADAFRAALAVDPQNASNHFGAALAAFARHHDDEARAAVDHALALDAQLPGARELLARLQYRARDLDGAIRTLEVLAAEAADDRTLIDTLARWRREAELRDRMHLTGGSGFTVAFEGPDDAVIAEYAVTSLEQSALRIGTVLGYYPSTPVQVVLYTREQFRDITRSPSWAGGSFDGIIRVPIGGSKPNLKELDRVLAHEYTHALIADLARMGLPAWFNEGLAVALENPTDDGATRDDSVGRLPLSRLGKSFRELSPEAAVAAYATSGAALRQLLGETGGPSVVSVLRDVGLGTPFDVAFERWVGLSVADFSARLSAQ